MIDAFHHTANAAALLGNLVIFGALLWGVRRFGRRRFLVCFACSSPIVILMCLNNLLAGIGEQAVQAVYPGKLYAVAYLVATGLYPIALILNVAGILLLLGYIKERESEPKSRQVSPGAAPSASPDEPSS
ncbi:MAG: hypothetical protein H7A43_05925 [Verrucomicrobia bacterium]|nr:hypothetical protein [Verrucomicrobiota bacterium]